MLRNRLLNMFTQKIAVDLGTVNTLVGVSGTGIVLREPSAVAVYTDERDNIVAVGSDAIEMLGRTPGGINAIYPLRDGVVTDYSLAEAMLKYFIYKALGRRPGAFGVSAVLCVPGCITEVERKALEDAARAAGAKEAHIMDEALAAAIGAGIPIHDNCGSMVVDIGGGTTNIAVIAMGGIAVSKSIRIGGTHLDETIIEYMRKKHGLSIGSRTAEQIKVRLGSAIPGCIDKMEVRGKDLDTGLPVSIDINAGDVNFALRKPILSIIAAVREVLAQTPPELAGDLMETGIVLTGGGARLHGLADLVERETKMDVYVADDPEDCVILGALDMMDNWESYPEVFRAG